METLTEFFERLKKEGLESSNIAIDLDATNDITLAVFKETGADWEKHYPQLYRDITEILMRVEKEYNRRVIMTFSHHNGNKFFLNELGENCKEYSNFEENQAFKNGYNKAVSELKEYFDSQKEKVIESIKRAFTLRKD